MGQLEDYRMFVQIVEHESISKAADHLGIAKSAVSRRLALLEDQLGTNLLTRTSRQWSVSDTGRLLYDRASLIIADADELRSELSSEKRVERGAIRISIPLEFGISFLSPVLLQFTAAYPDIHLTTDFSDRFVDLVEGNYDLAVRISKLEDSSLKSRKLTNVSHVICASPAYLAASPPIHHPEDLKGHAILQYGASKRFKWVMTGPDGRQKEVSLASKMNADSAQFLLAAAKAGQGIVRVPNFIARQNIEAGDLVTVLDDYQALNLGMYALYPEARHLPRRVRLLLDFLVAHSKACNI